MPSLPRILTRGSPPIDTPAQAPTTERANSGSFPHWTTNLLGAFGRLGGGLFGRYRNEGTGAGTSADKAAFGYFEPSVGVSRLQLQTVYGQSWAAKKFIDIPVDDAFVRWRAFDDDDGELSDKMREAEIKHSLPEKLSAAMRAGRLMGSGLLLILSTEAPLESEFKIERLREGDLKNLLPIDRFHCEIVEVNSDIYDPCCGNPTMYRINMAGLDAFNIHATRVVRFDGIKPPSDDWEVYDRGWGLSELIPVMVSIHQDASVTNAVSHLAEEASIATYKASGLRELLAGSGDPEYASPYQVMIQNLDMKSNYRTMLIDSEDEFERVNVSWGGLPQLLDTYAMRLAAAADIPITRFLGRAPQGLNATGEGDMRNYALRVEALQRRLLDTPLELLDQIIAQDAGIAEPPDYRWLSLVALGQKEEAEVTSLKAQALTALLGNGVLDEVEARQVLSGDDVIGYLEEEPDFLEEEAALAEEDRAMEIEERKTQIKLMKSAPPPGTPSKSSAPSKASNKKARASA